ncbi:MAG TPA: hypothetical protein VEK57_20805 [Thermoanaerobaculia bacterium]|nr:hypothetical protein [Thermoanaerobaculia bacterium]
MSLKERAVEVHKHIPPRIGALATPIVRSGSELKRLVGLPGDDARLIRFDMHHASSGDWTHVGDLAILALEELVIPKVVQPRPTWSSPRDHASLSAAIASGTVPDRRSEAYVREAFHRLSQSDSAAAARLNDARTLRTLADMATAADYQIERRTLPTLLTVLPGFVIPDVLAPNEFTYVVDQLWVVDADGDGRHVRLLALDLHDDVEAALRYRRTGVLAAMGYEPFIAQEYWARVDPQRVLHEFFKVADVSARNIRELLDPGPRINDYRCAWCRVVMIRDEQGYGIVSRRGLFVHEECFNRALNDGTFEHGDSETEHSFSVMNFR